MVINQDKLLENIFKLDLVKNNKHTSLTQVCLFTIKSLIPNKQQLGVTIDYKRFLEEANLWRFYKEGSISSLENYFNKNKSDKYFELDPYFYPRGLAIISASIDEKISEREVMKNLLLTSANPKDILLWISLNKLIFNSLNNYKLEDNINNLKEYIINLSQDELFNRYKDYFMLDINKYKGNYFLEFEKSRVELLTVLNMVEVDSFISIFEIINAEKSLMAKENLSDLGFIIIHSFNEFLEAEFKLDRIYYQMINHVDNLRRNKIDENQLIIKEYILPNVFLFEEKEEFYHSLLNKCKVIKKEVKNNILIMTIHSKTGRYVFKAVKSN